MKNTLKMNIGLARQDGGENTAKQTGDALRAAGFIVIASRLVTGAWEGKPETTLAIECFPSLPLCHHECRLAVYVAIERLARSLDQTCIAVEWSHGLQELIPPVAEFDSSAFIQPLPDLTRKDGAESVGW